MGDCIARRARWLWAALLLAAPTRAEDSKWVWGGGRSRGSYFYPDEFHGRPDGRPVESYRPAPPPVHEISDYSQPPFIPDRPVSPVPPPGFRPRPGQPPPGFRPPPGGPGILTGPVPSWEQGREVEGGYKNYERCKCAHSFNCNTPGISFGSCDVGKQYCCYNPKPDRARPPGGGPGFGVGGSPYDRPVLVGPGGPTGIIGNPERPYGRPFYGPDDGFRPGFGDPDGFYDGPPFDSFARSAADKRKGDKKN